MATEVPGGPRLACGYCFRLLDPREPTRERGTFVRCARCRQLFHAGCRPPGECPEPGCRSPHFEALPDGEIAPPGPLPVRRAPLPDDGAEPTRAAASDRNRSTLGLAVVLLAVGLGAAGWMWWAASRGNADPDTQPAPPGPAPERRVEPQEPAAPATEIASPTGPREDPRPPEPPGGGGPGPPTPRPDAAPEREASPAGQETATVATESAPAEKAPAVLPPPQAPSVPATSVSVPTPLPPPRTNLWLELGGGVRLELVAIPPGEAELGTTPEELAWAASLPGGRAAAGGGPGSAGARRVRVAAGVWIGRTEVTVAQWRQFTFARGGFRTAAEQRGHARAYDRGRQIPRETKTRTQYGPTVVRAYETVDAGWKDLPGRSWRDPGYGIPLQDDLPVSCVSWDDAVAFCEWLGGSLRSAVPELAALACRLPTEAEWEYACRGGRMRSWFWWGDTPEEARVRCNAPSQDTPGGRSGPAFWPEAFPWQDGHVFAAAVDSYGLPGRNGFGLADMLGNLGEWCLDAAALPDAAPAGSPGATSGRVVRGGSFGDRPALVRCAARQVRPAGEAASDLGFRVLFGPAP